VVAIQPGQNGDAPYRLEAYTHGGTIVVKIPPNCTNIIEALGLSILKDADGPDRIELFGQAENGPYGDYSSMWNPEIQEGD
jgi:hypothetical protein